MLSGSGDENMLVKRPKMEFVLDYLKSKKVNLKVKIWPSFRVFDDGRPKPSVKFSNSANANDGNSKVPLFLEKAIIRYTHIF